MSGGVISFWVDASGSPQVVDAAHPLPVAVTGAVAGPVTVVQPVASLLNADVQGPAASGSPPVGGPVLMGGVANSVPPATTNGNVYNLNIDGQQNLRVSLWSANANVGAQVSNLASDGLNPALQGIMAAATLWGFNGATYDRVRASAADSLVQKPYALRANDLANTQTIAAAGTTAVFAAAGAGFKNFMTALQISSVAASVATTVQIKDGATVLFTIDWPAAASHDGFTFPTPLQGSANTAMNVTTDAAGPIKFNAQGYKG